MSSDDKMLSAKEAMVLLGIKPPATLVALIEAGFFPGAQLRKDGWHVPVAEVYAHPAADRRKAQAPSAISIEVHTENLFVELS